MLVGKDELAIKQKWEIFFINLQRDLKLFIFMLGVFCLFRVGFIIAMQSFLGDAVTLEDIAATLYYGFRISIKSAGLLALVTFGLGTALRNILPNIRYYLGAIYVSLLSLLFQARIPYYQEFHTGFNQLLFNTLNDDVPALFNTVVVQYNLPLRLFAAAITAFGLCKLLKPWLASRTLSLPHLEKWYQNLALRAGLVFMIACLSLFIRFGGSLLYAHDITWENSGMTKDQLLNEAILDDVQALYRAYILHERLRSSAGLDMEPERMAEYGAYLAGHPIDSLDMNAFLEKKVSPGTASPPRQVFLIMLESYANWPLLPAYQNLGIANGLKDIIAREDAVYVANFLPNGLSTVSGLMGLTTGLADANMYLNYLPESYKAPFATALAPQMKRLGYTTDFWYGGPNSWERIQDFTLAQGFDAFYGMGDFDSGEGNMWGCDDYFLYQAVLNGVRDDQPGFHVILTVSNHSPYSVNLEQAGFKEHMVTAGLPEKLRSDRELIKKLGHFWYSDKMLAQFVATARQRYPDSLFLIVGDHADRLNLETNPLLYERYGIPLVLYGKGINKHSLPPNVAGSHINITPTLLELVAPPGFPYYSLGRSLTKGNDIGMNYGFWITSGHMGRDGAEYMEAHGDPGLVPPDQDKIRREIDAVRAFSWWRLKYGPTLPAISMN